MYSYAVQFIYKLPQCEQSCDLLKIPHIPHTGSGNADTATGWDQGHYMFHILSSPVLFINIEY